LVGRGDSADTVRSRDSLLASCFFHSVEGFCGHGSSSAYQSKDRHPEEALPQVRQARWHRRSLQDLSQAAESLTLLAWFDAVVASTALLFRG